MTKKKFHARKKLTKKAIIILNYIINNDNNVSGNIDKINKIGVKFKIDVSDNAR